jgi:hypothetical protein
MAWTGWRKLAEKGIWYDNQFDYDGPTCYELAIRGPRGGQHTTVYCGHSSNEDRRMLDYGSNGSHLEDIIQRHLEDGWHLYYRGWCCGSKKQGEAMERRMLSKWDYPWNLLLNGK